MAQADIPVDLFNPGQVFACLGFLEAADVLLDDARGDFDWHDEENVRFRLFADGKINPVEAVLAFLAETEITRFGPIGYTDAPRKAGRRGRHEQGGGDEEGVESGSADPTLGLSGTFPAKHGDRMTLPIRIGGGKYPVIRLGHWADGSGRERFKLYSGNRSADKIARAMLKGVRKKRASKTQRIDGVVGDLETRGLAQLWEENRATLIREPFHVLTPMGGSFNFDPRGAWTAIDAGYSPNDQSPKHSVEASPVVEFLAAWGLEHARPMISGNRQVHYTLWDVPLSPMLARAVLAGAIPSLSARHFHFKLSSSGKNKIVTFSEEEV